MTSLSDHRKSIRKLARANEFEILSQLRQTYQPKEAIRLTANERAIKLVENIRADGRPGLMEVFLAEYALIGGEAI